MKRGFKLNIDIPSQNKNILNRLKVLVQIVEENSESMKQTVKYDIFNIHKSLEKSQTNTPKRTRVSRKTRKATRKMLEKRFNPRIDPLVMIETKIPFTHDVLIPRKRSKSARKRQSPNRRSCYSRLSMSELV